MKRITQYSIVSLAIVAIVLCSSANLRAQKAAELDKKVDEALAKLIADSEAARNLSKVAKEDSRSSSGALDPSVSHQRNIPGDSFPDAALGFRIFDGSRRARAEFVNQTTSVSRGL